MLRIERTCVDDDEVLKLEGKLTGPWVGELRRSCAEALERARGRVVLDLADVSFADREGIGLLRDLSERGAALVNGSPFVLEQLNEMR